MDVSPTAAVNAVMSIKGAQTSNEVQMLMLRKSLDNAASSITGLIDALPQPPLATSGTLGTQLNAYA